MEHKLHVQEYIGQISAHVAPYDKSCTEDVQFSSSIIPEIVITMFKNSFSKDEPLALWHRVYNLPLDISVLWWGINYHFTENF